MGEQNKTQKQWIRLLDHYFCLVIVIIIIVICLCLGFGIFEISTYKACTDINMEYAGKCDIFTGKVTVCESGYNQSSNEFYDTLSKHTVCKECPGHHAKY